MLDNLTKTIRCAIYTRKSSDEGLDQEFNSLDAQRESCEAYIRSQQHEGWITTPTLYDDGGFSGGSMDRPALKQLLEDVKAGLVNTIIVYKVDRLTRSLMDFSKIVEILDSHGASFVSITQQFNTTTSMGRLTLNVLLSFAQFEREVTAERIRDKVAQSKAKGMWTGGCVPLGYDAIGKKLVVNAEEAATVRLIFGRYLELGCVRELQIDLEGRGLKTKQRMHKTGRETGGGPFSRSALYQLLRNRLYIGEITHRGNIYPAQHEAIVRKELWEKVQGSLAASAVTKTLATMAESPALLAGIVYDDKGHRMTSTHSNKKKVRYRYYTSQAILQNQRAKAGLVTRVPAQPLEMAVLDDIKRLLRDPAELMTGSADVDSRSWILSRARERASEVDSASASDLKKILSAILRRVDLAPEQVSVQFSRSRIRGWLDSEADIGSLDESVGGHDEFTRRVPIRVRKTGRGTKLVLAPSVARPQVNESLVNAILRANGWLKELLSGQVQSIQEIADRENLKQRYTARILRLAFLAPEIADAILLGRQPAEMELKALMDLFPAAWAAQEKYFLTSRDGASAALRRQRS